MTVTYGSDMSNSSVFNCLADRLQWNCKAIEHREDDEGLVSVRGSDMDSPQFDLHLESRRLGAPSELIAIQEAALRQMAAADPEFDVRVQPLLISEELWWRVIVCLPGYSRHLRLVDGRLRDRRWRQLNALARFVCRSCGTERRLTIDLNGIDPELLATKGE